MTIPYSPSDCSMTSDRPLKSPPAAQNNDTIGTISILKCLLEIEKNKNIELSNRIVILEGILQSAYEDDTDVDLKPVLSPVRFIHESEMPVPPPLKVIREDGKPVSEKSGLMSRFFRLVFGHDA